MDTGSLGCVRVTVNYPDERVGSLTMIRPQDANRKLEGQDFALAFEM